MAEALLKDYCGILKTILGITLEDIPFDEMLESVIGQLVSGPIAPVGCGIWTMEDGALKLKAFRGLGERIVKACSEIPPGECVCGRVAGGVMPDRGDGLDPVMLRYGGNPPGAHLCVPMVFRGKTLGVMNIFMEKGHRWKGGEEEFLTAVAGIVSAILDGKRKDGEIEALLRNDRITGLLNLQSFTERVDETILKARYKKRLAAVLTLDIDRFRVINGTMGFEAANELLRSLALRLKECFYESDVLARTGEDEFAALLLEVHKAEDTFKVVRKVSAALSKPLRAGPAEIRITAGIGVSIYPFDGERAAELMKNSQTAMHRAKESGRSGYRSYSPAMDEKAATLFRMEGMMREAIEKKEFLLHYQPKCELKTGLITGVEALIRWQNPEMGLVAPADFIPIAEDSGLIVEGGRMGLEDRLRRG